MSNISKAKSFAHNDLTILNDRDRQTWHMPEIERLLDQILYATCVKFLVHILYPTFAPISF